MPDNSPGCFECHNGPPVCDFLNDLYSATINTIPQSSVAQLVLRVGSTTFATTCTNGLSASGGTLTRYCEIMFIAQKMKERKTSKKTKVGVLTFLENG